VGFDEVALAAKFERLFPHLNERQRRLSAGAEAAALGFGGLSAVARASGLSVPTVRKGAAELAAGPQLAPQRSRRPGGGRKRAEVADPELAAALESLVDPATRGDPESPLRWTTKSTRRLARTLSEMGHRVSHVVVGELLRALGYSLQANAKMIEGAQHADRDAQFGYINEQAAQRLAASACRVGGYEEEGTGRRRPRLQERRPGMAARR
jgi:DDE family transposase